MHPIVTVPVPLSIRTRCYLTMRMEVMRPTTDRPLATFVPTEIGDIEDIDMEDLRGATITL